MKYSSLKVIFIFPFLLFPIKSFGVPVDIQDISGEKYFQAVHKELAGDKAESEAYKLVSEWD